MRAVEYNYLSSGSIVLSTLFNHSVIDYQVFAIGVRNANEEVRIVYKLYFMVVIVQAEEDRTEESRCNTCLLLLCELFLAFTGTYLKLPAFKGKIPP